MGHSTYSFADLAVVFTHPGVGILNLQGEGLGSITFAKSNDMSQQDLASDGSVMTSKIKAPNGTIAISVQQTSDAAKWLTRYVNFCDVAPSAMFTMGLLIGKDVAGIQTHTCSGISPQKMADKPYQQDGQHLTFTLMAQSMLEVA
jgi:hypothetical protein